MEVSACGTPKLVFSDVFRVGCDWGCHEGPEDTILLINIKNSFNTISRDFNPVELEFVS